MGGITGRLNSRTGSGTNMPTHGCCLVRSGSMSDCKTPLAPDAAARCPQLTFRLVSNLYGKPDEDPSRFVEFTAATIQPKSAQAAMTFLATRFPLPEQVPTANRCKNVHLNYVIYCFHSAVFACQANKEGNRRLVGACVRSLEIRRYSRRRQGSAGRICIKLL